MSTAKIDIDTEYSKKFEEQVAELDELELSKLYDELFERVNAPKSMKDVLDALKKMEYINRYLEKGNYWQKFYDSRKARPVNND
ncbi:MAG: hypothetical protein KAJ56_04355 [Candidatus Aenigmarchaeota archaeon]|nr:hypothetical protein [Candidatus Aenigmarchaeota archaeon]